MQTARERSTRRLAPFWPGDVRPLAIRVLGIRMTGQRSGGHISANAPARVLGAKEMRVDLLQRRSRAPATARGSGTGGLVLDVAELGFRAGSGPWGARMGYGLGVDLGTSFTAA